MNCANITIWICLSAALLACDNIAVRPNGIKSSVSTVTAIEQISVAPGGKLNLSGVNLKNNLKVLLGNQELAVEIIDSRSIEISVPSEVPFGLANLTITQNGKTIYETTILVGDQKQEVPEISAEASTICSDIIFKGNFGDLKRGERDCSPIKACTEDGQTGCVTSSEFRAGLTSGLAAKIAVGEKVAKILGEATTVPLCTSLSKGDCVADGEKFKAIHPQSILDADIKAGVSIAGVIGTFNGRPADCTSDGELSCVAVAGFPAIDKVAIIDPRRNEFSSSYSIAGVNGLIPECLSDGGTNCITSSGFPAVNKAVNLSASQLGQIHSGITIAGESGALESCAADGASNCVVEGSGFIAAQTSGVASKIIFGQTLAGISGSIPPRPENCSIDGEIGCVASATFPAVDKVNKLSAANLAKIQTGLTIAGEAGTLGNCSTDGSNACVALGPSFAAANISGAAPKIIQGQSLAGITGTAPSKPADCSIDGGVGCTTISDFPAIDSTQVLGKVLIGQTLGGLSGGLTSRPLDCSSDGDTSCVTNANFTAVNSIGAAAKILASEFAAGIQGVAIGKPTDCSSDGGSDCVTSANFPSIDKAAKLSPIALAKIHTSVTLGGESGTLSDCVGDGEFDCFAVNSFPAAEISGAAAKIIVGQTLAGQSGSAPSRPFDCSSEGQSTCVATSSFPAIDKNGKLASGNLGKLHSTISIVGISGTMVSCNADGQSSCMTSLAFKSAAIDGSTPAKIPLGDILAGVTGTANAKPSLCATDGAIGCTSSAGFPAANAAGAQNKIALGEILGGVSGIASVRPTECASDGATNCVASSNFPVIEKNTQLSTANMAKVSSLHTIGGVSGTLPNCATEGDSGCIVVGPSFAAMQSSGAAAKILLGQSVGGINGTAPIRPANCSSDNASSCVAVGNYPAVNRASNLGTAQLAKIHNSLTFLGSSGALNSCSTDGDSSCLAVSGFVAANASGAAAKILSGSTAAGITGTAAVRPSDCSSSSETACVATTAFPAVDKVNKIQGGAGSFRPSLTLLGTPGTLNDCSSDGGASCVATTSFVASTISGIQSKILSGQVLAGITGNALGRDPDCTSDGQLDCIAVANFPAALASGADTKITGGEVLAGITGTAAIRPADCSSDAQTSCVAISAFPAIDKVNKLDANKSLYASSLNIAGIAGTLNACSSDGSTSCISNSSYPAMQISGAAAKILLGSTLGGESGSAPVRPSDCAGDNGTGCVATATYPAVVKSNISSNINKIRPSLTVAATAGTFADCSSDGDTNCFAVTGFPAVNASTAAAKILVGSTLGGVSGTAPIRPADCSAGNTTGCTTVTSYPSVDKSILVAGVLKSGFSINGVTGDYPSSTYPLQGNSTSVTDLTASNINSRLTTNVASEWFDSIGTKYSATGYDNFSTLVKSGTSILGVTGTYAPNCSADGQIDCKTVAAFPAAKMSNFNEWDIRYGYTYAGVSGKFHSPSNFAQNNTSNVYSSLTDRNNNTGQITGFAPAMPNSIWVRDGNSDSNSNGVCDGSEECVYFDRLAQKYWNRIESTYVSRNWEDAITFCENLVYGGYTDWRLPMEKELIQARINGLPFIFDIDKLNHQKSTLWTATTNYTNTSQAIWVSMSSGDANASAKTDAIKTMCVR